MFPNCAEGLVARLWCYWEVVEPLGMQLSGRKLGHWALEGDIWSPSSYLPPPTLFVFALSKKPSPS
jgi:hypothetical protein